MSDRWSNKSVALHWVSAAVIMGMGAAGFVMSDLASESSLRLLLSRSHTLFGFALMALTVLRLVTRWRGPSPAPLPLPPIHRRGVDLVHTLIYVVVFALGASGVITAARSTWPDYMSRGSGSGRPSAWRSLGSIAAPSRRKRSDAGPSRASAKLPWGSTSWVGSARFWSMKEPASPSARSSRASRRIRPKLTCAPRRPASVRRAPRCSDSLRRRSARGRCSRPQSARRRGRSRCSTRGPFRAAARRGERPPPRGARRARSRSRPAFGGDPRHRRRGGRRRAAAGRHGARHAAGALRWARDAQAARARRHGHHRLDRAAHRRHEPRVRQRRGGRDDAAAARRGSARRDLLSGHGCVSRGPREQNLLGGGPADPRAAGRGHARATGAARCHRPARRRAGRGRAPEPPYEFRSAWSTTTQRVPSCTPTAAADRAGPSDASASRETTSRGARGARGGRRRPGGARCGRTLPLGRRWVAQ
jgi:hypothetical protein